MTLTVTVGNERPVGVVLKGSVIDTQVFPENGVAVGVLSTED